MAKSVGERRIVSTLLVDIADSTEIGERLGPERSKFLFDEVVRLLAAEVKRFGGTVAQFTGDGLYALFGVPAAHDDDAERSVRAARAMQAALEGYAADLAAAYGVKLAARIGVNTGPVVVVADESPAEERYNALGDTVNTAARLQAHAGNGGIVVGSATAAQVESAFDLESVGLLELKGKAERVAAFRVIGERERVVRRLTPLIGRDDELATLDQVLGGLAEGRGAIVAITGEPGIGKSRLVAEARSRWQDTVRYLTAQGVSYAQAVPYYPLRELLRSFLGVGVGDPEARVRLELKAQLSAALGDRADPYYPFLASLLGLALETEAEEHLRGLARDSVQRQTHEAVTELARALSRGQPLALVLEDLHFADEPTLELIDELLSLTDEEAVALLLLYRNDPDLRSWALGEAARRRYRHRFQELQLNPLDPGDGVRLAASAAEGDLADELVEQLAARTGGNPLFLEEAARDAVERGDGALVPAALEETLQARLDRLPADVREVASFASVVGRSFGMPLLERLVPAEQLRPALSELQRLDLVVEERRLPTREYRFRHGLVQEAAYASLLQDRRREVHRLVGVALEDLGRDELSEAYGLLAYHFAEAGEPRRAARYLLEAGDTARSLFADEEALRYYRRALHFLDELGETGRARSVLFKIALTHHLAFDFEATDEAWAEAFSRPESPPQRLDPVERLETAMAQPETWVPGHGYDLGAWSFGTNFFRGLLQLDRDVNVVPDLAERFTVSNDGQAYSFRLREGLRWSDGEPLTARDFAFTYRAMREQAVASAHLLGTVEAEAPDERTVELRLDAPDTQLLYLLAQPAFFPWPQHHVEAHGPGWHKPAAPIGNGPFVINRVSESRAEIVANTHWRGSRGNVRNISVSLTTIGDGLTQWNDGALDFLFTPRSAEVERVRGGERETLPLLATDYVAFPPHAPFDDERLRKALAHGLDRTPLVAESGHQPARGGLLPPPMPGHTHELAPAYDPARARALLAAAGYDDARGPELRLLHADPGFGAQLRDEIDARWAGQWRELGVQLTQEWVGLDQIKAEASEEGSFFEWGWVADYPDPHGFLGALLEQDLSPLPTDDETRRLLERGRSSRSRDERLRLYRELDRYLVAERTWLVPTAYNAWQILRRPWVEGLWGTPFGVGTLGDIVVQPHD
jgi:ABC-type transport system substrate-binding protein/class 3 adenylate cyclase